MLPGKTEVICHKKIKNVLFTLLVELYNTCACMLHVYYCTWQSAFSFKKQR